MQRVRRSTTASAADLRVQLDPEMVGSPREVEESRRRAAAHTNSPLLPSNLVLPHGAIEAEKADFLAQGGLNAAPGRPAANGHSAVGQSVPISLWTAQRTPSRWSWWMSSAFRGNHQMTRLRVQPGHGPNCR